MSRRRRVRETPQGCLPPPPPDSPAWIASLWLGLLDLMSERGCTDSAYMAVADRFSAQMLAWDDAFSRATGSRRTLRQYSHPRSDLGTRRTRVDTAA